MVTLHRSEFFLVQHFQASRYVRITRTELQLKSCAEAAQAIEACRSALVSIDLTGYGVLWDWRPAPMSTDPSVHRVIVQHVDAFARGFERRAILVKTPVGQMQVGRVGRAHSEDPPTLFNEEEAAILHVAWSAANAGA